jgi:AraC family transcriptional regulator, exoenzyme S synthesis regulatory protein ExsA
MALELIPQSLYTQKNMQPILSNGRSSILHKTLSADSINMGKFISTSLIVYLLRGRQIIRDHDGMSNVIEEGHLIFLPKDIYFVSDFIADQGVFEALLFFIDDKLVDKYLRSRAEPPPCQKGLTPESGRHAYALLAGHQLRKYMAALRDVYGGETNAEALLEPKLLELLHLIASLDQSFGFVDALSNDKTRLQRRSITEFMETHSAYDLKIEDYAALTGRSVSTFMRDFKKAYDTTPTQWMIDKRVDIAHRMLVEQNASVAEAALEAGYENVSHFIKAYKRKFGMTPKKAREAEGTLHLSVGGQLPSAELKPHAL